MIKVLNNENKILLKKVGLIVLLIAMASILPVALAIENMNITSDTGSVYVGIPRDVKFTVTTACIPPPGDVCAQAETPVSGASVQLSGAATGSGTTGTDGTVTININANSPGDITATANATGYNDASITIHAYAQPLLKITADTSFVYTGISRDVKFTVTEDCPQGADSACTQGSVVPGASIQLTGAATGSGTTGNDGTVTININAGSQGTITATAGRAGYTSGTATIKAELPPQLKITADTSFVYAGTPQNVKFTVTENCPQGTDACTQGSVVPGASIQLTGAATGSGTTGNDGTVTININAGSQGTITATAGKAGYTSGTATIKAELPPNLIIAAYPDTVYAGTPQNVKFTVTEDCPQGTDACTQGSLVSGASVQLTGVATGSGTTGNDGTVTININASSQGTITATARKSGHTDSSIMITADYFPLAKITVEKTTYFRGEPVNFTFTNTGTTTIETGLWFIWNTSQKISPINTTAIAGDFLAPGESVYFSWNQRDNKGQQVPPWTYKGSATYNKSFITHTDQFEITSCSLPKHTDQTYSSYVSEPVTFSVPLDTSKAWNVKWYLNGTQVKTDTGVTKSNYTIPNPAVGVWNITAVADSGCNLESWTITWTVNDIPVAKLTTERNNYSVGEIVVLTLTNIGTVNLTPDRWGIWNISLSSPVYTSPQLGTNVLLPGQSVTYSWDQKDNNGQQVRSWQYKAGISWTFQGKAYWNFTKQFEIIKCVTDIYEPMPYSSEVGNVITFKTGNLTSTLKSWNVTWYLNGIEVHNETGVTGVSNYTNKNAAVGVWNVTAVAIHGCDLRRWTITWTVTPKPSNPPPSGGSSGGGGGGGGGGITTAEPFANILKFERQDADLIRNSAVTYKFTSPVFSIYQVLVTGKENEGQVGIRIEHLKDTSALVSRIPAGIIYANENIWIGSKRIDSVVIRFRVNNSWITENDFEKTEIKLLRFDNGWKKLNTKEINSDSTYTYFESGSPGLSSFAVSGIKEETQDARGIQALVDDTNPDAETDLNNSNPTEASPGFDVIAGIGIISVAYLFWIRRKK